MTGFLSSSRSYCTPKEAGVSLEKSQFPMKFAILKFAEKESQNKPTEEQQPIPEEVEPLIKIEKTGTVTLIGINRPDVRNCINTEAALELTSAIDFFENDPESPIAVLYGVGGNFSAGYDLKEISSDPASVTNILMRSEGAMVSSATIPSSPLIDSVSFFRVQQEEC